MHEQRVLKKLNKSTEASCTTLPRVFPIEKKSGGMREKEKKPKGRNKEIQK